MTMNKIMAKLRKQNKGQYKLLGMCIFLSVLLVTSFALMFFSKSMQSLLPPGGDTRKLAWLLFGVTVIGCMIFTIYGANLFYKYKSREFGIFLALGEQKKKLRNCLAGELAAVIARYVVLGIVAAIPVSFLIWKVYQAFAFQSQGIHYQLGIGGVAAGLFFALVLVIGILITGVRFIRRANIMDILNDQRKTELVKEIHPSTGKRGIVLIVIGLFLAMAVPPIMARLFLRSVPSVWNATYLISVIGLYMVMLSAVGNKRRGKHPEKYYKHIISTNLMRFTARQTTKNMCVITMLLFVILISSFWGIMYFQGATEGETKAAYDYSMHFPKTEKPITREEIYDLAKKHQVDITSYEEPDALELVIRYTGRDWNEDGKYMDVTYEKLASFLSASDFERISGHEVTLAPGEYETIVPTGYKRTIWEGPDCLEMIQNPTDVSLTQDAASGDMTQDAASGETGKPVYKGTAELDNMTGTSAPFAFILSDEDYNRFASTLTDADREQLIFFNVKDMEGSYTFAEDLKDLYISQSSEKMAYDPYYDAWEEKLLAEKGEKHSHAEKVDLSTDNENLAGDWKYEPFFRVLKKAENMGRIAVFLLLSFYIAIIALTAAGVMSYVRSLTIAIDNRQLFDDMEKLGANRAYKQRVIKTQLKKIFSYPVMAASLISMLFILLLTYFNDMTLNATEVKMVIVMIGIMALIGGCMYGVYRISFRKMEKIVEG